MNDVHIYEIGCMWDERKRIVQMNEGSGKDKDFFL